MNLTKSFVSAAAVGALLLNAAPAFAANSPTVQQAKDRCQQVAGLEKSRCLAILKRSQRLRLQNLDQHISGRGNTLREQRMITNNNSVDNVRTRSSQNLKRLRTNMNKGVAPRRTIRNNASDARNMCRDIKDDIKQAMCIRTNLSTVNRGGGVQK